MRDWSRRRIRARLGILVLLLLSSGKLQAGTQTDQPGALLPLQDRVGDPVLAAAIEETLYEQLGAERRLVDPGQLRNALRRLRIRDASSASPTVLQQLAQEVSAGWFFSVTLHDATETELTRATQVFTAEVARQVPQIILSARILLRAPLGGTSAGTYLGWVGFASASGLDGRNLLGVGVIDDPELLARRTVRRLVTGALAEPIPAPKVPPPVEAGFQRQTLSLGQLGSVAVVPFEGVSDRDAMIAAETVTELALSVLHENGVQLVSKGRVSQILRRRGILLRGEVDSSTREVLHTEAGADNILTGTVETWEIRSQGAEPEPLVGFGARLIDASNGQILWMNGLERGGWEGMNPFGLGRTHSQGRLAQQLMRSLLADILAPRSSENRRAHR